MRSIILFILIIGLIMVSLGYQRKLLNNIETKTIIEYRYIPRSIYDEQFSGNKLESTYADMFEKQDVFFHQV